MQDLSSVLANLGTAVTITYAAFNFHASAVGVERRCKEKSIQNKPVLCQKSPSVQCLLNVASCGNEVLSNSRHGRQLVTHPHVSSLGFQFFSNVLKLADMLGIGTLIIDLSLLFLIWRAVGGSSCR
jgi:hypothetical protein